MDTSDEHSDAAGLASPGPDGRPDAGQSASDGAGGTTPFSRRAAARRGKSRRLTVIVSVAAAVVLAAGAATAALAVTRSHGGGLASLSRAVSPLAAAPPVTAVADVTPPVAAGGCGRPVAFSYSGTLSAAAPGLLTYRWLYPAGRPGPAQTIRFARAGSKVVAGQTVTVRKAGGGWAELQVISPVARTSDKAAYRLLCGGAAGGITVTAAVTPADRIAGCAPAAPDFTATGAIRVAKAETVTYYWAQSDGRDSAVTTLTFRRAGAQAVRPLSITPPAASGTAEAVLVVTRPLTAASRPAAYTLNCQAPGSGTPTAPESSPAAPATTPPGASSPSSPASRPSSPPASAPSASSAPLTIDDLLVHGGQEDEAYNGSVTVSGGDAPYRWSAAGLPPGLAATPSGSALKVSGAPTTPGTFTATVSVTDKSSPARSATMVVTIIIGPPVLTFIVSAPSTAVFGQPYSGTITATGGDGTYNWSTTTVLPGLILTPNGATLTISGAPALDGTGPLVTGTISDGESPPQTLNWVVDITIKAPPPSPSVTALRPLPPLSPAKLR